MECRKKNQVRIKNKLHMKKKTEKLMCKIKTGAVLDKQ